MFWYSHLFQSFPQFIVIHTVKGFGIVNKAGVDVFLEPSCFYYDLFWGAPKITADGDCSHEIKRRLLFERKVMTNLDSIFKSKDIILPTKVRLVKAVVFPVVMYGCESWTVKKAERQGIHAFEL